MRKLCFNRCLLMLLSMACIGMLMGCTNEDYDFDKVDWKIGIGGERLSLPNNNSTSDILLNDLLDIENSDLIKTTETGDYIIYKESEAVNPVSVNIKPITLSQELSAGQTIDIQVPQALTPLVGQLVRPSDYSTTIEGSQCITIQDYAFDVPKEVNSLEYIEFIGDGATLKLTLTIPGDIKKFDYISIELPEFLQMTCVNDPASFDTNTNTLFVMNYTASGTVQFEFKVTRLKIMEEDENNYAKLINGKLQIHSTINLSFKVAELIVPSVSKLQISGEAHFTNLIVTSAHGTFDPHIDLKEAGVVTITSLPSFLLDENVVFDLDNPQIWLTVRSNMPLGGTIKSLLRTDTYRQGILMDTPERTIRVKGSPDGVTEVTTEVLICRYNPGVSDSDCQVIEVAELPELFKTLREGMKMEFLTQEVKASQENCTIQLGHEYELTPSCLFNAPLAFGPQAVIVYNKTIDNWNGDLKDLSLANDAYIHVTGTAVNRIPADLILDVTPLGTDGKSLSGLSVELIKKEVAGTTSTAVESPIELKISDPSGNAFCKLNGIQLSLKALSNESLRGVTLNKSSQTLTLKDIDIELIGKMIYDAN